MFAAVRTLIDPANRDDLKNVHALQDSVKIEQPGGPGTFEIPRWDEASRNTVKAALQALGGTLPDLKRAFGTHDTVDPVRHLIGVASGWGGNPDEDAIYLNVTPRNNDGSGVYRIIVKDVPVDGFWSISVYNREGHFVQNALNAYTLNSAPRRRNPTARSLFSSEAATTTRPTVCRSFRVGTTWCASIDRGKKFLMAPSPSLKRSRLADEFARLLGHTQTNKAEYVQKFR
jgi:hypothetical protein